MKLTSDNSGDPAIASMEKISKEAAAEKPLAEIINVAWAGYVESENRSPQHKREYVYASSKRDCLRRQVLEMTEGDKMPPFDTETLAKFRRGNDRERDLITDLARAGRNSDPPFEVINQQERFELKDKKGRVAIVGKVDARLNFSRDAQVPVEIKSWSVYLTNQIESFADLFKSPWTKPGAYQLLAYLFGSGEPYGILLLDRPGLPLPITVSLEDHLDLMEEFLTNAEKALDHKYDGTLPDYIEDPAECQRCPFYGRVCDPPLKHEAAKIFTDPEFEAALERREELKAAAKEFNELDKKIKKEARGVTSAVAGDFVLKGSWRKKTVYDVPKKAREAYEVLRQANKRIQEEGSFHLEITKL